MGYYDAALALREQWMADDFDSVNNQIKGRKNGLVLSNNGAKFLPYRPWGVNPDGSVNVIAANNNDVRTAARSALDITGDIELTAKVALTDWTPTGNQRIIAKRTTGTAAA